MHRLFGQLERALEGRHAAKGHLNAGFDQRPRRRLDIHMVNPKVRSEISDKPVRRRRQRGKTENPVGMRLLEALAGREYGWLSQKTGIPASTISDYVLKGISSADNAVKIADALDISLDGLLRGSSSGAGSKAPALVEVGEADWVALNEYDLRLVDETGKGQPIGRVVFRRDWLYVAFAESSGLWITRTLTPDPVRGLPTGSAIVCKDHPEGERPLEGQHYIFWVNGGVLLARFSYRGADAYQPGEALVMPADLDRVEGQHFIIARALGALARPLV